MSLPALQEQNLRRRAEERGVFRDLICFYGAKRDFEQLRTLGRELDRSNRLDALVFDLMALGFTEKDHKPIRDRLDDEADSWMFYSFCKFLLQEGKVQEAMAVARRNFDRDRRDTATLNLIIKYLIHTGEPRLAGELIERSLHLNPLQKDIKTLKDNPRVGALYLDVLPRPCDISFYLPVYNVERFIRDAIEGLLAQNYPLSGIVVVNDGTQDKSMAIAREYPVTILEHTENRGLAAARNTAFFNGASDYLGAVDTDATPDADFTRNALVEFENGPETLVGVGGRLIELNRQTPPDLWRSLYIGQDSGVYREYPAPMLFGCAAVFSRAAVISVGGYDEKYRTNGEDAYISHRLLEKGLDLVYTPYAVALHKRTDTLDSVLKTRWNYFFWYLCENGYYSSREKCLEVLAANLGVSVQRIAEDLEAGRDALLYLHVLMVFHNSFMDLNYCVGAGLFQRGEAHCIQEMVLDTLKGLDARLGGDLYRKVRSDVAHMLQEESTSVDIGQAAYRPKLDAFLADLAAFLGTITDRVYRVLTAKAPT